MTMIAKTMIRPILMHGKRSVMTYREWLKLFGNESCSTCRYNIAVKAKCTYKGKCVRYDRYIRDTEKEEMIFPVSG